MDLARVKTPMNILLLSYRLPKSITREYHTLTEMKKKKNNPSKHTVFYTSRNFTHVTKVQWYPYLILYTVSP